MDKTKNIFVSHYHTDADSILKLKSLLDRHGLKMKDSSIYESKNPNNANNEEYIKSLIRPRIDWAGTTVVLIGKNTSKSDYVNWEIEHAASKGKRIVGVYLQGESDSEIPEALNKYGNSLQKWNGESIISGITGDNTCFVSSSSGSFKNLIYLLLGKCCENLLCLFHGCNLCSKGFRGVDDGWDSVLFFCHLGILLFVFSLKVFTVTCYVFII